ncbi:hypothetical protein J6590_072203 [Homalodisca vitripennis]|nr:hypothetical protein J6590_072203 [Homalodisca vitripennis]
MIRASSAKRCAAEIFNKKKDHARCLPAAQRFVLLDLLEIKLTRVVPNLKPRSRIYLVVQLVIGCKNVYHFHEGITKQSTVKHKQTTKYNGAAVFPVVKDVSAFFIDLEVSNLPDDDVSLEIFSSGNAKVYLLTKTMLKLQMRKTRSVLPSTPRPTRMRAASEPPIDFFKLLEQQEFEIAHHEIARIFFDSDENTCAHDTHNYYSSYNADDCYITKSTKLIKHNKQNNAFLHRRLISVLHLHKLMKLTYGLLSTDWAGWKVVYRHSPPVDGIITPPS